MIFFLSKNGMLHQVLTEELAQTYAKMFPDELYFFAKVVAA